MARSDRRNTVLTLDNTPFALLLVVIGVLGCAADRDREPWDMDRTTADPGETDSGPTNAPGADETGGAGGTGGGDGDGPGPETDTDDGTETDDSPADDPPPDDGTLPELPWNCEGFQPNYPDERPYQSAKELCSWINNCRSAYSFHSRYPCGGQEVYPGEVTPDATWPIEMAWDPDTAAVAQAEADALAAGAAAKGRMRDSPLDMCAQHGDYRLWIDSIDDQTGVVSNPYTVTARDNDVAWTNRCSALGKGFAFFRIALAYVDDCGDPVMTRFGCGLAEAPDGDQWAVVRFVP